MDIGTDQGVSVIRGVCFYEKIEILALGNFLYGSSDCYGRVQKISIQKSCLEM